MTDRPHASDKVNAGQYEHAKHLFLIGKNKENLKNYEEITELAKAVGEDASPIILLRVKSAKAHITHSKLMSDFWMAILEANHPKAKICIKCMKENALLIDESMSELVQLGQYTEQQYITHMNRFRDEFNIWEYVLECDLYGFLMARERVVSDVREIQTFTDEWMPKEETDE